MADTSERVLAGLTLDQADEQIAAREAAVEQLEGTLKTARDGLKAARAERKRTEARRDGVQVVAGLGYDQAAAAAGDNDVQAGADAAEASGRVER